MEYACGTGAPTDAPTQRRLYLLHLGLVAKELAAFCKHLVGVDISQGMVDQFNKRADNQKMHAVCVELKGEPGELGNEKFDVIVVRTIPFSIGQRLTRSFC